jgi:hypothetical protein
MNSTRCSVVVVNSEAPNIGQGSPCRKRHYFSLELTHDDDDFIRGYISIDSLQGVKRTVAVGSDRFGYCLSIFVLPASIVTEANL